MDDLNLDFIIVLACLQAADILTTHAILSRGGYERNRVMAWMFEHMHPVLAMVLMKSIFVAACGFADLWWLTAAMCVFYLWIVVGNVKVIWEVLK